MNHCSFRCWCCLTVLFCLELPNATFAQVKTASLRDGLAALDASVIPPDEKKTIGRMLFDALAAKRQALNEQHTAVWERVKNKPEWEAFVRPKVRALRESLGEFPAPPRSLNVRITGTVKGDGFRIQNLVFESRPGLWVTANLYEPATPGSKMPGILVCHAHHTPKEHGELQDMGMTWARAGCLVLVMDQLGHGERRQHPFADADSYPKPFRVSRQDYHFRYDSGIQLHVVGDSLMGWMVWDLMRGVDLLLGRDGIDPERILLLGAVAGGGDPAAVTAALDERIAAVAPFNFGRPSPAPHYPFAPDKEPSWNFIGGGSWESTRNLRRSGVDGFLPWVIVAAAAPRRLVYAHEFGWYREGDPTWKRLQKIYSFYDAADRLAFTFGKGDVTKKPPEATHCTHIGSLHRKMIHDAFARWFGIQAVEYSNRLPADMLRCWTADAKRELRPRSLADLLTDLARERIERARKGRSGKSLPERRQMLQADWRRILGEVEPVAKAEARRIGGDRLGGVKVERVLLSTEGDIVLPLMLLLPPDKGKKPPVVVAFCQAGKHALLRDRRDEIAELLEAGVAVCLPDVRATGEITLGSDRGRVGPATGYSSSLLMHGETLLGGQLRDLRSVLAWLRTSDAVDAGRLALWGDSTASVNSSTTGLDVPRDPDVVLPPQAEPLGGMLAMLAALYENDVRAVYIRGGLAEIRSVLDGHLVLTPHDAVPPGVLASGDLSDLAATLAPCPLSLEGLVDGRNRVVEEKKLREIYQPAVEAYRQADGDWMLTAIPRGPSRWLIARLLRAK